MCSTRCVQVAPLNCTCGPVAISFRALASLAVYSVATAKLQPTLEGHRPPALSACEAGVRHGRHGPGSSGATEGRGRALFPQTYIRNVAGSRTVPARARMRF
jgi:hypothetical protein